MLTVHISQCEKMENTYGTIFKNFEELIEMNPNPETWNNMKALAYHFKERLTEAIKEQKSEEASEKGLAPGEEDVNFDDDGMFTQCTNCKKKFDDF